MAFAWIAHSNFEGGSNAEWDSEADTDGILDFPHYSELARWPWSTSTPYSGAYCARIKPAGGTNDATLTEADINIANTATSYFHFNVWFGPDFDATANDTFQLFELQGAASAITGSVGARYVASTDVINMGIGSAASAAVPTAFASLAMKRNAWYTIEAAFNIETNGSGTADLYITEGNQIPQATADASVATVTNIAVTDGVFGLQDHLATTTGTILLDNFIQDDARVYPTPRYQLDPVFTKSGHAFVGPGSLDTAALLTDEATNAMVVWDTDRANVDATQTMKLDFDIDNQTSYGGPVYFEKGCYVVLSGTNPRGQVNMTRGSDKPGAVGPRYHTDAGVRRWGQRHPNA
ncbi:MAG: hypothetical protein GY906_24380 [bacterium]|nr:hypothetical protein [bacterium]